MIKRLKYTVAWLELHPRVSTMLGMLTAALAVFGLGVTLWLHADDSHRVSRIEAQRQADHAASQATAAIIDPVVCRLVYSYTHPVDGRPVAPQILDAWHAVGQVARCPYGTKP